MEKLALNKPSKQKFNPFQSILNFFFYHNIHYTGIKNKKHCNHQVLFYISSTWKKGKNKLKQPEIEVKMIIKMKKHNLCSSWQIILMNDTDKRTLIDLYEIFIVQLI